jgi:hypothetical protein
VAVAPAWYRIAVTVTDEWAAAVRALVNAGRRPLAEALALALPATLAQERQMWTLAGKLARLPYDATGAAELDQFRAPPGQPESPRQSEAPGQPEAAPRPGG